MLKGAIKANTENQTKLMAAHDVISAKTDEIFTNLTVYYADKKQEKKEQAKDLSRSEQLQEYTKRTGCKVEKYEDIFIDMQGENPKLLLTGKPGIGKTMFCDKIIRDWSMNRLFLNEDTPNIQFAYLLKFRHLDGDEEINLQELLNCSPLLDDNSKINDSLFEHLIQNPSKVLIILDGFDECSEQHRKQIADDYEGKYPNDSREKMPIPALCSKLIRGKVFRNSVVLVSSRPGKAEELGKINFDRYVEISGHAPEQVTEYVDKYFSKPEKERTKKAVREHVGKNKNLLSFCHIPLFSFLLCWCLEWRITHKGITENLPAKITDLYDEVAKVLVQNLHANLKYLALPEYAMKIAQETLDKLAKLAAILLKESKYIFDEDDMKKLDLTEDEIENLKVSGILHCVPGIRISPFQTKAEFSFTHLTLQEYLSASFFVKNKEIPKKEEASGQTFVFMCGLLLREKDGELMNKLIQQITPKDNNDHVNKLVLLQCLYEYGEQELTKQTINNMYDKYCSSRGDIGFHGVTDVDMKYLSYLLDIIRSLKEQHPQSSRDYTLRISGSPLTSFGVGVVCRSLVRNSFITILKLSGCSLDDKCVEQMTDSLVDTGITDLDLNNNSISDEGADSICSVLTETKITGLNLGSNIITDQGIKSICSVLTQTKITHLELGRSNITDEGADSICRVIIQDDCHVKHLVLLQNLKITAECKKLVRQLVKRNKRGVKLHI
ncbi:NACHT, LRR and PYD domains-containing protein 12-like [Actinia tenebrosa]|uniref:NACHT, LRR and PYD domains-containing protein 12-like n=1 Tax=Actinia tenebrosa TaxID=6105 RepID=A0A6P8ISG4_ACTTE|nr:NACHT, LRR and PYD domains-containing protein 12-like [Actinia tenebrosa]